MASGATISPQVSFKNHDHRFCRTYVIDTGNDANLAGVACRTEKAGWRIPIQVELARLGAPGAGPHVSADGDASRSPAVEKFIDNAIDGETLGPGEEAAAIAGGWGRDGN